MKVKTETGKIIDANDYQIYTKGDDVYVWYNDWKDDNFMVCVNEKVVAKEEVKDCFYAIGIQDDKVGVYCYPNLEEGETKNKFVKSKNFFESFDEAYDHLVKTIQLQLDIDFYDENILDYLDILDASSKRILVQRLFFKEPIARISEEEKISRFKVEQKIEEIAHQIQLQILKDEKGYTLDTPVNHLPLTMEAIRKLKRIDVKTLGELMETPYSTLYRQKNFGPKLLSKISECINESVKYSIDRKLILRNFMRENCFRKEEILEILNGKDD
jgi:hypothetical protein